MCNILCNTLRILGEHSGNEVKYIDYNITALCAKPFRIYEDVKDILLGFSRKFWKFIAGNAILEMDYGTFMGAWILSAVSSTKIWKYVEIPDKVWEH